MSLEFLGLEATATKDDVLARYKELAKTMHPDRGGTSETFQQLQHARDEALKVVQLGATLSKAKLQVSALREAARGTRCPRCDGTGSAGEIRAGFRRMTRVCRLCRGTGKL